MLYREIIAVCSQIHTKHINTLCGHNVEFLTVKPGGRYQGTITTGPKRAHQAEKQAYFHDNISPTIRVDNFLT